MNSIGVTVHSALALGGYLHIDTDKCHDMGVRSALVAMGATEIKTLPVGADGRHLDGSGHHRIVGIFQVRGPKP